MWILGYLPNGVCKSYLCFPNFLLKLATPNRKSLNFVRLLFPNLTTSENCVNSRWDTIRGKSLYVTLYFAVTLCWHLNIFLIIRLASVSVWFPVCWLRCDCRLPRRVAAVCHQTSLMDTSWRKISSNLTTTFWVILSTARERQKHDLFG